jgi:hypothetical protein
VLGAAQGLDCVEEPAVCGFGWRFCRNPLRRQGKRRQRHNLRNTTIVFLLDQERKKDENRKVFPSPPTAHERARGAGPGSDRPRIRPADNAPAVEALLRDLGPQLLRGTQRRARSEAAVRLACGIAAIDALVAGGFPRGRLSEIAGPLSSGRTSVTLALLARTTRAGEVAAVVDAADAFDPASAEAAGVVLERVLWARPTAMREALRCSQRLLETRGFALVVLDLARACAGAASVLPGAARRAASLSDSPLSESPLPESVWQRLARAAAAANTALVLLSSARRAGAFAEVALEMQSLRAHFVGAPTLLESLEIEAVVARQRTGPVQRVASVRLGAPSHAA